MQQNLFTEDDGTPRQEYNEAFEAYNNLPKKRIHNEKPTYTKTYENYQDNEGNVFDDVGTWGRMDTVYLLLANHCLKYWTGFGTTNKLFDVGMLRYRRSEYDSAPYEYQGKKYRDLPFKYTQAEIIGSELLPIEERLFLHESLLEYLDEGYTIEQLNWWIESLLNLCLQGYSARLIVLALILMKGEDNVF